MDFFWAAPPVTRTLAAAVFIVSVLSAINVVTPYSLAYIPQAIFRFPPQLWRLVSSFLLTFKTGIIMDPFFIWQSGVPLETNSARFNSASFFLYIIFVGVSLIILAGHILGAPLLLGPLSLAITYTFAQENRGERVQFFVINMDVKWLPYARLLLTFIMGEPINALIDSMGIVVAHLYDFLTIYWPTYGNGASLIKTPAFVTRMFYGNGDLNGQVEQKAHGSSQRARPSNGSTSNEHGGSGAWRSRGPGRRLGGD